MQYVFLNVAKISYKLLKKKHLKWIKDLFDFLKAIKTDMKATGKNNKKGARKNVYIKMANLKCKFN